MLPSSPSWPQLTCLQIANPFELDGKEWITLRLYAATVEPQKNWKPHKLLCQEASPDAASSQQDGQQHPPLPHFCFLKDDNQGVITHPPGKSAVYNAHVKAMHGTQWTAHVYSQCQGP